MPNTDIATLDRTVNMTPVRALSDAIRALAARQIEEMARRHLPRIQLLTASTTASRFYVNLDYSEVHDRAKESHEKLFGG